MCWCRLLACGVAHGVLYLYNDVSPSLRPVVLAAATPSHLVRSCSFADLRHTLELLSLIRCCVAREEDCPLAARAILAILRYPVVASDGAVLVPVVTNDDASGNGGMFFDIDPRLLPEDEAERQTALTVSNDVAVLLALALGTSELTALLPTCAIALMRAEFGEDVHGAVMDGRLLSHTGLWEIIGLGVLDNVRMSIRNSRPGARV